ncbi:hypothetical protein ACRAWD_29930 [Caulobacter segnis]
MVPAFVGLGAPYWDPQARRPDPRPHAGHFGGPCRPGRPGVGGVPDPRPDRRDVRRRRLTPQRLGAWMGSMAANEWLCAFLAGIIDAPVERPINVETTALGAALPRGAGSRRLAEPGGDRRRLATGPTLRPQHGARPSRSLPARLAGRRGPRALSPPPRPASEPRHHATSRVLA